MAPVTKTGRNDSSGFTLLEIILVTGIILVLVAVIVPQAIRINTSSKYNLVQQAAAEIGKWGIEWGERNLESQNADDTCVLNDYISSLSDVYVGEDNTHWVDAPDESSLSCRPDNPLLYSVAEMVDSARQPRNPFTGLSYFSKNDGYEGESRPPAGLLYLARREQNTTTPTHHYYFVYTGTDSVGATDWYAGMGAGDPPELENMKNGIFMSRLVQ